MAHSSWDILYIVTRRAAAIWLASESTSSAVKLLKKVHDGSRACRSSPFYSSQLGYDLEPKVTRREHDTRTHTHTHTHCSCCCKCVKNEAEYKEPYISDWITCDSINTQQSRRHSVLPGHYVVIGFRHLEAKQRPWTFEIRWHIVVSKVHRFEARKTSTAIMLSLTRG